MKINWNPMYSPVWRFIAPNALAVFVSALAKPDLWGDKAGQAQAIGGLLAAGASVLAAWLKKPEA